MKILLVIFTLCVADALSGLTDEQKAKLFSYKASCLTESGVDPAVVENVKEYVETVTTNEKLFCYGACLLKRIGIMDEEGVINTDIARGLLPADIPQEERDEIIDRCKGLSGNTACHTGGLFYICFIKYKTFDLV